MIEGILIAFGILAGFYKFRKLRAEALEQEYKAKIQRLQYKKLKSELRYRRIHYSSDLTSLKGAYKLICGTFIIT